MTENIQMDQAVISVTSVAAEKIRSLLAEKQMPESTGLRVFVSGGGCSGMQYGMAFEPNPREDDTVTETGGVQIIVDPISMGYIYGANIDFVDTLMGGGFSIENPNAVSSCGCGHSFRTSDEEAGAYAEGGSCGCQ